MRGAISGILLLQLACAARQKPKKPRRYLGASDLLEVGAELCRKRLCDAARSFGQRNKTRQVHAWR